jgi:signal transduction histidine kinase
MIFFGGKVPMAFFVVAVIFSAERGIRAGFLAIALSLCAALVIFQGNLSIVLPANSMLGLFVAVGIVINVVFYKLHRTYAALNKAKEEVDAVNRNLVEHAESLANANAKLAGQKIELFQAHEQLQRFNDRLAHNMQVPLRTISVTADILIRCNAERFDARSTQASELMKDEIQRMDTLVADLRDHARDS